MIDPINDISTCRHQHFVNKSGSSFGCEDSLEARWSLKNLQYIRTLWSLSDEQYQELSLMKDKLADIDHFKNNPYEVTRFVTGPQGFDHAERLFRECIAWRIENNVDEMLETYKPPQILLDYLPSAILAGTDKEGDPIYLERGGAMDGPGFLTRYGREKLMKHIIWSRELASRGRWIEEYERKMGRPPTRLTIIYDMQGLNSRHMKAGVLPFLTESMRITQQRYNGLAKKMIIIRAPPIFNVIWGLCKYAFPQNAVKKMVFSGPNNYLEVLDNYVDRQVLPPCIFAEGKGGVAIDMPRRLEGGRIPPEDDISLDCEDELEPISETAGSGDDSSTSTWLDSIGESLVRSNGMECMPLKVRCKRIIGGRWAAQASSSASKVTRVISIC